MFDFIRKEDIWRACDHGLLSQLNQKISYQLKTAQDLAVLSHLHAGLHHIIGEVGGGDSRILTALSKSNRCFNIEKFEGKHLGPAKRADIENVTVIDAYVGTFDKKLEDAFFDTLFSISVVEHVETQDLDNFFNDSIRILKPGGIFVHAIDMYLEDQPSRHQVERFDIYRSWVSGNTQASPLGPVLNGPPRFSTNMATNPDNILYGWNTLAPMLAALRMKAQSVSLIVGGVKR